MGRELGRSADRQSPRPPPCVSGASPAARCTRMTVMAMCGTHIWMRDAPERRPRGASVERAIVPKKPRGASVIQGCPLDRERQSMVRRESVACRDPEVLASWEGVLLVWRRRDRGLGFIACGDAEALA